MNSFFVIEGNIGSGKSTLCELLRRSNPSIEVLPEPVDLWKSIKDEKENKNLLQYYYDDQYRWGFSFQLYGLFTRMQDMMVPKEKEIRFVERSIYSYKHVFARSLYEAGKMTDIEWNLYQRWFEWLSHEKFSNLHDAKGYIYLRADPKISYQRMLIRERSEEKCVPLEYLDNINRYHDDWLKTMDPSKLLIIDVNEDFEHTPEVWSNMYQQILDFISQVSE